MEYLQLSLDVYQDTKKEIKKELGNMAKSFVRIGWQLTRIDQSGAYKMDGYKSIAEFARAEYGMNPTGVSRFMSVYERYSAPGDTPELQEQFREFKYTQLVEMMKLPEEDLDMITPDTKREDIRELDRFNKENDGNPDNLLNWKKEPENKVEETIVEFFKANKEITNTLFGSEAYRTGDLKKMVEIINPSGNRSFRKGTVFLMMSGLDAGVKAKDFATGITEYTWEGFLGLTQSIFAEAAAGSRTWENYFEKSDQKEDTQKEPANEEQEEQIPGQDNILNHPEYMPKPEEEPEQEVEGWLEPEPEKMTSICYSCEKYEQCDAKSATVTDCNQYGCRQKKTEEQQYEEEQKKIDAKTKKKLQELEDEKKMNNLPSDSKQIIQKRMGSSLFTEIENGAMRFFLEKKKYSVGDLIELMEFDFGKFTGRSIRVEVTSMLGDYTGLEDGYYITGIRRAE